MSDPSSVEALVGRVADEFTERLNRGERPGVEEYAARYPEVAGLLREVLSGLRLYRLPAAPGEPDPPTRPLPGGCLGDYRLVREVGRGGMGVVYEAEQISLHRRVAVKILPSAAALDPRQLQRFQNEAEAAANLHHANIVPVYAVGCDQGVHYYAMQFIEGRSLAELIGAWGPADGDAAPAPRRPADRTASLGGGSTDVSGRGRAFFQTVARLGADVALALEHAHQQGVIHRDIKPSNLLIDARGKLWVTDFGLAHVQGAAGLTMTGDLVGTLRYMSPEQALARHGLLDHRTDLYSLGATLYELLTHQPVFPGGDRQELLRRIAFEEPRAPRRLNPGVPAELETIVLKALAKSPDERYATAQELADDLGRFLRDEPIRARRPSPWQRTRKFLWRHRAVSATAALALTLGLVATVIGLLVSNRRIREEEANTRAALTDAEDRRREAEFALTDMNTTSGLVAGEQGAPAQAVLWFANAARLARSDPERESANRTRVRLWSHAVPVPVLATPPVGRRPERLAFHPTAPYLLVRSRGPRCDLWRFDPEEAVSLPGGDRPVSAALWSPDGRWLVLATPRGEVEIWSFPEAQLLYRLHHPGAVTALAFSPDGHYLAVASDQVRLWDGRTGQLTPAVFRHPQPVAHVAWNSRGDRLVTACQDNQLRVFAVPGTADARPLFAPVPGSPAVRPAFIDHDRGLLSTGYASREVFWWDAATGARVRFLDGPLDVLAAASPDGRYLVLHGNPTAQVWSVEPPRAAGPLDNHRHYVGDAVFSPDSQVLLTVSANRTARLTSVPTGRLLWSIPHQGSVAVAAYGPDGRFVATGQEDGLVRVWRLPARPVQRFAAGTQPSRFKLSRDGRLVLPTGGTWFGASNSSIARAFEVAGGAPFAWALWTDSWVLDADLSPDGKHAAVLALPQGKTNAAMLRPAPPPDPTAVLSLWDVATRGELLEVAVTAGAPRCVSFRPDGRRLGVLGKAGEILVLDTASGRTVASGRHLQPNGAVARALSEAPRLLFTADGRSLITCGAGSSVQVWDADTCTPRYAPLRHEALCMDVALSPDGRWLVTAAADNTARVWDLATGEPAAEPLRHPDWVFTARFSPDGSRLLTGCRDSMARLWDWHAGGLVCAPFRHADEVQAVAFTPDGRHALTGSADQTVRVWEWHTGRALSPPVPVDGRATAVQVTPDGGQALVAAGGNCMQRVALDDLRAGDDLPPDRLVTLAEVIAGFRIDHGNLASLTAEEWFARWRQTRPDRVAGGLARGVDPAPWHDQEAERLEDAREYAAAAWHLERLIALRPNDPLAHLRLGATYDHIPNQVDRAIAHYSEVIRLDPDARCPSPWKGQVYTLRGHAYRRTRQYGLMAADFSRCIQLAPFSSWGYYYRAIAYLYLNRPQPAVADLTESLRYDPGKAQAYYYRGIAHDLLKEADPAAADFAEALRLDAGLRELVEKWRTKKQF